MIGPNANKPQPLRRLACAATLIRFARDDRACKTRDQSAAEAPKVETDDALTKTEQTK
jgi:hypothetical protein